MEFKRKKRDLKVPVSLVVDEQRFEIEVNPYATIEKTDGFQEVQRLKRYQEDLRGVQNIKDKISSKSYELHHFATLQNIEDLKVEIFEKFGVSAERLAGKFNGVFLYKNTLETMVEAKTDFWIFTEDLTGEELIDLIIALRSEAIKELEGK